MKDLQPRSISKIIAKFQPSVIEKMKVSFLLSHLLQYYVLIDSEKFELAGMPVNKADYPWTVHNI